MAHDVEDRLKQIFAERKGGTKEKEGAAEIKLLRDRNRMLLVGRVPALVGERGC